MLATVVANYSSDFPGTDGSLTAGWQYQWNAPLESDPASGAIEDPATNFAPLSFSGSNTSWTTDGDMNPATDPLGAFVRLSSIGGHPGSGDGLNSDDVARYAIASFTVSESGFYTIANSFVGVSPLSSMAKTDGVEVRVFVNRETPLLSATVAEDAINYFDVPLGFLAVGDTVSVAYGARSNNFYDYFETDFDVQRNVDLEQTVGRFRNDFLTSEPAEYGWKYLWNQPRGWAASQSSGALWSNSIGDPFYYQPLQLTGTTWTADGDLDGRNSSPDRFLRLTPQGGVTGSGYSGSFFQDRFAIAAFTVEHSGEYGIAESFLSVFGGSDDGVELFIHVGDGERETLNPISVGPNASASFDMNLGFVQKGETIYVGFGANANHVRDYFETDFSLVRVLSRVAPDLSLLESGNVVISVNDSHLGLPGAIPDDHQNDWQAIQSAIDVAWPGDAEIHFDPGTYNVSNHELAELEELFSLQKFQNLVIDGNGSTLIVGDRNRPLFRSFGSSNVIFKNFTIDYAERVPAVTGEVNDLYRPLAFTQGIISDLDRINKSFTLTVNTDAFVSPDETFVSPNSHGWGYAIDPLIDGRLKTDTNWHYQTKGVTSQTDPHRFTIQVHNVDGLANNDRYVLQRRQGAAMFGVYGESSNVTLMDVTAYSGPSVFVGSTNSRQINLIDTHVAIRPDDWVHTADTQRWKSINADGVHIQNSRVGAWIENSTFEGIGDDVMNFYTLPMTILNQSGPREVTLAAMTSGRLYSSYETAIQVGDHLAFFDPIEGKILKTARVIEVSTLTVPSPKDGEQLYDARLVKFDQDLPTIQLGTMEAPEGYRNDTTVFNVDSMQGTMVQDNQIANSRRYGTFLMSGNAQLIDNVYEGLSDEAIAANNEPGWPLGTFSSNVLIQGNDFINNGFSARYLREEFHTGTIAFKAGRFVDSAMPTRENDFLVDSNDYYFSNVRILDNVFYNWRKSAVSIRNSQYVTISGNAVAQSAADLLGVESTPFDVHFSRAVEVRSNASPGAMPAIRSSNVEDFSVTEMKNTYDNELLAWLKFDRGAVVEDSSGSGYEPSFNGAGISQGRFDTAVILNSNNSVTLFTGSEPVAERTIGLWFEARDAGLESRKQVIFEQGDFDSGMNAYIDNGQLIFGTWGPGFSTFMSASIDSGHWHHIAWAIDANSGKSRAYLDGKKFEVGVAGSILPGVLTIGRVGSGGTRLHTGFSGFGTQGYAGKVDDVRVFDRALGDNEIQGLAGRV